METDDSLPNQAYRYGLEVTTLSEPSGGRQNVRQAHIGHGVWACSSLSQCVATW